jgi:hypothetical protein
LAAPHQRRGSRRSFETSRAQSISRFDTDSYGVIRAAPRAPGTPRAVWVGEHGNMLNVKQGCFFNSTFRRTVMFIKDLEVSKELSRKELAAVRGGFNVGIQGGQFVSQAGLLNFASPVVATNAPSMPQNYTSVGINTAAIANSLALLGQTA